MPDTLIDTPTVDTTIAVPNSTPWYKSQIIWVQLVAVTFAVGSRFAWWPKDLNQADVITVVMIIVGIITTSIRSNSSVAPVTLTQKAADKANAPATTAPTDI